MKEIELIYTNIGKIPVTIGLGFKNNTIIYIGNPLYKELNIHIETPTRESCILGLKNAIELSFHFWIRAELLDIGFENEKNITQ